MQVESCDQWTAEILMGIEAAFGLYGILEIVVPVTFFFNIGSIVAEIQFCESGIRLQDYAPVVLFHGRIQAVVGMRGAVIISKRNERTQFDNAFRNGISIQTVKLVL